MDDWYEVEVPKGMYNVFAEVVAPPGYREVSRIFTEEGLEKIFF